MVHADDELRRIKHCSQTCGPVDPIHKTSQIPVDSNVERTLCKQHTHTTIAASAEPQKLCRHTEPTQNLFTYWDKLSVNLLLPVHDTSTVGWVTEGHPTHSIFYHNIPTIPKILVWHNDRYRGSARHQVQHRLYRYVMISKNSSLNNISTHYHYYQIIYEYIRNRISSVL